MRHPDIPVISFTGSTVTGQAITEMTAPFYKKLSLEVSANSCIIGNCRNMRGLGKSKVVFCLFEKPRYSSERSTKFEILYQEYKYLEEENGKMEAL